MKKRICVFAAIAVLLLGLAGCGTKAMCDFCGEEKRCETREALGEEFHICNDCLNELEAVLS